MRRPGRVARILAAVALVVGLAACGVQPDASPRDVPADNRANLAGVTIGGDAAGTERIYLLGPGEARLLRSVPRNLDRGENLIDVLFAGPNAGELQAQFGTAIPPTLQLLDIRPQGSRLRMDVSAELVDLSGQGLIQALAQIVYTASEIPGVQSVEITVEGEAQSWPTAAIESTTQPLRTYDFPGLVRTAQPAYPTVPSGA